MRFGLSTHLFHGERLSRSHIETVASHGFALVELFATRTHFDYTDPRHIADVKGWLRECGVTARSMHLPISAGLVGDVWGRTYSNASPVAQAREEAVQETLAAIDVAADLGCATGVLHLGIPRGQTIPTGDNDAAALRRSLEPIAAAATLAGVQLALEVIPNDLSTPGALVDLLEGDLELGDAAICLDVGHAHLLGDAAETAEALAGHVVTTHLHDNRGTSDDHLVPFAGTVDWAATLTSLGKIGYKGPFIFEVADAGDPADVLRRTVGARTRLQAILDELDAPIEFSSS
jgi:sugar phosphate isomerase/epimerase